MSQLPLFPRVVIGTLVLAAAALAAESSGQAPRQDPASRLWYAQPAADWNEALPLGNGRLGAMVFGGAGKEQFQLNAETIWSGAPKPPTKYDTTGPRNLPEIRRLTFENKWSEAQELFGKSMRRNDGYFAKYQPMGSLWLEFPGHEKVSEYRRELDLGDAVSRVRYRARETNYTREAFISPVDQVMVVRLNADRPGSIDCTASLEGERDKNGKIPAEVKTERVTPDTLAMRGLSAAWNADMGRIRFECRIRSSRGIGLVLEYVADRGSVVVRAAL